MRTSSTAVMNRRLSAVDSLDFFPTPPWATRALLHHVINVQHTASAWEPAAGEGHMVEVLKEVFHHVRASDVHDYGRGYAVGSFVGEGPDVARCEVGQEPDWIITNPPFNKASEFLARALTVARKGVALLLRTSWLEGAERFHSIFSKVPPSKVAVFSERVPMVAGRWDPSASSATSYTWFVWELPATSKTAQLVWIPPVCSTNLSKQNDVSRFTQSDAVAMPLFGGDA